MHTEIKYDPTNSGHSNSFDVGSSFEDFVCIELSKQGIILQNIHSRKFQYETGENLQGFEIKYDSRCTGCSTDKPATNRLSIEVSEKTNANNRNYIPSGIYRDDNSWLYIQGNYQQFWIFQKKLLVMLHNSNRYKENTQPTIKTFYLPIKEADKYCAKKIIIKTL